MSTKAELACVYASLILVDDDVAVTVSFYFVNFWTDSNPLELRPSRQVAE